MGAWIETNKHKQQKGVWSMAAKKRRGRKKKSQLLIEHETEQKQIVERLGELELLSEKGAQLKDIILIGVALDAQAESLRDMFEVVVPDLFKSV